VQSDWPTSGSVSEVILLWAQNDSVNQAMLALNQKLGYVRKGAIVRFVKQMR
jgi:hypothetical protein